MIPGETFEGLCQFVSMATTLRYSEVKAAVSARMKLASCSQTTVLLELLQEHGRVK